MRVRIARPTASPIVAEKVFALSSGNERTGTFEVDVTGTTASDDGITSS